MHEGRDSAGALGVESQSLVVGFVFPVRGSQKVIQDKVCYIAAQALSSGFLSFLDKTVAVHTVGQTETGAPILSVVIWNRSPCIDFLRATNYERHNQDALFALTKTPFDLFPF
jgi:hypothetical protein